MKSSVKTIYFVGLLALSCLTTMYLASCSSKEAYDPDKYLSTKEKDKFVSTVIRYAAKPPEGVSAEQKFDKKYDAYYLNKVSEAKLERYYPKGDEVFFLLTQVAPSLIVKRHATGGRIKLGDKGTVERYEEVFRTWKMVSDTLKRRSYFLFDKMVNGESLEPFLSKNAGDNYIEFPDDKVYFDVERKQWDVKQLVDSTGAVLNQ